MKCQDPCAGSCGANAECQVASHVPLCSCGQGFTGDPFRGCYEKPQSKNLRLNCFHRRFYVVEKYLQSRIFHRRNLLVLETLAEPMPTVKN